MKNTHIILKSTEKEKSWCFERAVCHSETVCYILIARTYYDDKWHFIPKTTTLSGERLFFFEDEIDVLKSSPKYTLKFVDKLEVEKMLFVEMI